MVPVPRQPHPAGGRTASSSHLSLRERAMPSRKPRGALAKADDTPAPCPASEGAAAAPQTRQRPILLLGVSQSPAGLLGPPRQAASLPSISSRLNRSAESDQGLPRILISTRHSPAQGPAMMLCYLLHPTATPPSSLRDLASCVILRHTCLSELFLAHPNVRHLFQSDGSRMALCANASPTSTPLTFLKPVPPPEKPSSFLSGKDLPALKSGYRLCWTQDQHPGCHAGAVEKTQRHDGLGSSTNLPGLCDPGRSTSCPSSSFSHR